MTDEEPQSVVDNPDEKPEMKVPTPLENLRNLGIEVNEKDFHDFIFRGTVTKTVDVVTNPLDGTKLTAKIKTVTTGEMDFVDELVAEDLEKEKLTRDGLEVRQSLWLMAFAVLELNGRPIARPVVDQEGKLNAKETAKARRKVLSELAPVIINKLITTHRIMVSAFNAMLLDGDTVKK